MKKIRGFEVVNESNRKHPDVDIQLPTQGSIDSAGLDFYLPHDVEIAPFNKVLVWTDVKAYMQRGEVLELYIRSSMGIKKGLMLSNTVGIIDKDYYSNESNDGNIGISLFNTSAMVIKLKKGERIAQGIFKSYLKSDNGNATDERKGGIGSTND